MYCQNYYITSGKGESIYELVAFDNALINAGISNYNLVRVSSILPIGCSQKNKIDLKEGSMLLTAYGTISSSVPGERIASAVAIGIPADKSKIGVIMEYSGKNNAAGADEIVREMVKESMSRHGLDILEIKSSSIDCVVPDEGFVSVISAVSIF